MKVVLDANVFVSAAIQAGPSYRLVARRSSSRLTLGGGTEVSTGVEELGVLAEVVGDGGHGVGEGFGLFGSEGVEDEALDVFDVDGCEVFEPFATCGGEGGVLGSAVVGVL